LVQKDQSKFKHRLSVGNMSIGLLFCYCKNIYISNGYVLIWNAWLVELEQKNTVTHYFLHLLPLYFVCFFPSNILWTAKAEFEINLLNLQIFNLMGNDIRFSNCSFLSRPNKYVFFSNSMLRSWIQQEVICLCVVGYSPLIFGFNYHIYKKNHKNIWRKCQ